MSASARVAGLPSGIAAPDESVKPPTVLVVVGRAGDRARDLLKLLEYEHLAVETVPSLADALEQCAKQLPSIVILHDESLRTRWVAACESIHAVGDVPIVIGFSLPAPIDPAAAFEMGVAAYVADPTRVHEMAGRIRALLRLPALRRGDEPEKAQQTGSTISIGSITIDVSARNVTAGGRRVHLSRLEFDLLCALLSPAGRVHSREDIIQRVWPRRPPAGSRTLDTHVRRLRLKLGDDPVVPRILVNVRGVGFRVDPPATC